MEFEIGDLIINMKNVKADFFDKIAAKVRDGAMIQEITDSLIFYVELVDEMEKYGVEAK